MGIRRIVPGTDPSGAISDIYRFGRSHPGGKPSAPPTKANRDRPKYGGGDGLELDASGKVNIQRNQMPEDAQAPGYHNEPSIKSWLRGGANRPGFDSGPSGRRYK